MKNRILKVISAALACVIICAGLVSCSDPLKSTEAEEVIVMTVGDFEVPYEFYRYLVLNYKQEIGSEEEWADSEKVEALTKELEKKVEDSLRSFYAVFELAKENGVYTDNDVVKAAIDAALKATRNGYKNDKEYVADLAKGFMNHSVYALMQSNSVCSEELYYALMNNGKIEAGEEQLKKIVFGDDFIRIKQILVVGESHSKASDGTVYVPEETHTDAEALAIAETALEKARAGEDFDTLVSQYGESFHMFSNKDGYYICNGMWDDVNEDAAFALEIGEISDIVESSAGYSIFLRCEKDEEYLNTHYDELCENYTRAQFALLVEEKSKTLEGKKTDAGKEIVIADVKWEDEEK